MFFLAVLSACSNRPIDYAVVLWPEPESGLEEGELVPVLSESEIQDSLTVEVDGQTVRIDAWRVLRFEEEPTARAYQEDFSPWATRYGRSLRTALPVRERADRTTTRVYRLRDGEIVKILNRQDEPSNEGGLEDYWYRVLTQEGISGWVFGYHLEVTGPGGRSAQPTDERDTDERLVEDIAAEAWRPEYFADMIRTGNIVLDDFDPRFGLFGDLEAEEFRITLPDFNRTFPFAGFRVFQESRIEFQGTDLTLTLSGRDRLSARYPVSGRETTTTFVRIEEDLQELITAEQERRAQRLQEILDRGNGLVSSAFGSIALGERGTVTWRGFERLVPTVLPREFGGTASLAFSLFLADDLRGRYDGALRMQLGSGRSVAFLYTLVDDGLRLVYVPENLITERNVVADEPISPVVMFYRFTTS